MVVMDYEQSVRRATVCRQSLCDEDVLEDPCPWRCSGWVIHLGHAGGIHLQRHREDT